MGTLPGSISPLRVCAEGGVLEHTDGERAWKTKKVLPEEREDATTETERKEFPSAGSCPLGQLYRDPEATLDDL